MWKDESIRKGIISSVIASLVVIIFIDPLLNFIWGGIANGGSQIQEYYVNLVYKNAALGNRNWLDVIFYLFFLSIFCGGLVILNFWLNLQEKELFDKVLDIENKVNKKENVSKETLSEEQIKEKVQELKERFKKGKWRPTLIYILFISILFCSILSYFLAHSDLQLNVTFQQRIRIVAPFIDEQKEEELNSQWAQMKSRDDYKKIIKQFNEIAKNAKIELPEPLMK